MDNYTGKRLDGRYEIQEVMGVGGMAVVYKAYDNIDDRIVAVKILKEEYLANEEFRRRFKNESKAIAVLSHPNIVKVFNVSYGDRLQYIVMEYVEGITLKEYIEQQGKLGIKETVHFTMQILRALQHAHDKGIVHRDIKPQNIMLLSNGNIKVTDFGIARFSYSDTKTMTDSAIGSVHYISPEQARGDTTDDRADIYSVGVVMYEMLTGQLPFQADSSVSVALMQLQNDPKRPRELNSSIPVGLEQITMHAMQKNAADRYQSAAEMLLDIEEFKRNPTIRFQQNFFVDNDPTKYVSTKRPVQQAKTSTQPQPANTAVNNAEYDDSDEKKTKLKMIAAGAGIGLAVLLAVIFAILFFFTDVFKKAANVVPNFAGSNYVTVQESKEYDGIFTFDIKKVPNSGYQDGVIYGQEPKSGTKVTSTPMKITLTVASNEQKIPVTDVYGMMYEQAKRTLESKGFTVTPIPMVSTVEEFGTVIKTDPERNVEALSGSTVTIYYASDEDLISVPQIVGYDTEMAKVLVESVYLTFDTNVTQENSNRPAGEVIRQTPEEGEKVLRGSKVSVVVSNGTPESAKATFDVALPATGNRGTFEVFVNNESQIRKTLLMDGNDFTVEVEGAGASAPIKVYINDSLYYSCNINFSSKPAKVSNGSYVNPSANVQRKQMPDVQGMTYEEAYEKLQTTGFYNINKKGQITYDSSKIGVVISQSPSSSIVIVYPVNTEIDLYVGTADGIE